MGLLVHAADPGIAGDSGLTPLVLAADSGHVAVVTALLNARASIDVPDSAGRTALMSASAFAHKEAASVLLEAGADALARAIDGSTALLCVIEYLGNTIFACDRQHSKKADALAIATMLLAAQADPAAATDDGRTPMQLMEVECDDNLVMLLSKTASGYHKPDGACAAAGA